MRVYVAFAYRYLFFVIVAGEFFVRRDVPVPRFEGVEDMFVCPFPCFFELKHIWGSGGGGGGGGSGSLVGILVVGFRGSTWAVWASQ